MSAPRHRRHHWTRRQVAALVTVGLAFTGALAWLANSILSLATHDRLTGFVIPLPSPSPTLSPSHSRVVVATTGNGLAVAGALIFIVFLLYMLRKVRW